MGVRVLKFGGTSVASTDHLASLTAIVRRQAQGPYLPRVVVVVSALAGITNELVVAVERAAAGDGAARGLVSRLRDRHRRLLTAAVGSPATEVVAGEAWRAIERGLARLAELLADVAREGACDGATHDAIVATGERLSAPLVAAALVAAGVPAVAVDSAELVRTDDGFGEARVDLVVTGELVRGWAARLPAGLVPVVTGFIGGTADGRATLLGRGASDYSAGILGAVLSAEVVEIWSDVDGVMSADPRLVPRAATLPWLGFDEVTELAQLGARVLHPRTLQPLAGRGIPVWVRNTSFPAAAGSELRDDGRAGGDGDTGAAAVRAVSVRSGLTLLVVEAADGGRWSVGALDQRLTALLGHADPRGHDAGRAVMAVGHLGASSRLALAVPAAGATAAAASFEATLSRRRDRVALVAAVGAGLAGPGATHLVGRAYAALARAGVEAQAASFGASDRSFTVLVDESDARRAANALHEELVVPARAAAVASVLRAG